MLTPVLTVNQTSVATVVGQTIVNTGTWSDLSASCSFAAASTFSSGGSQVQGIAEGDFNGDGKSDVVVGNAYSNTIGVLLGDGSGGFAAARTYPCAGPFRISVGDFNGDGISDLAVADPNDNIVEVLLSDGTGGFAAPIILSPGGSHPISVAVGDFNGDGNSDLAVANFYRGVSIFLGDGTGGFSAPRTFSSGGSGLEQVVVGDFNGDGKSDLAVANVLSGTVGVLLGDGKGGFSAPITFSSGGSYPNALCVGDFNGDGNSDLAVANFNSNTVGVLLGDGHGGFAAASTFSSGGVNPGQLVLGDFNGDGKTDLAVSNYTSGTVGVLLGDGEGGFSAATTFTTGSGNPCCLAVGDFNGDDRSDLAVANGSGNTVGVLLNTSITVTLTASVGQVIKNADGTWSWSYTPANIVDQPSDVTITASDGDSSAGITVSGQPVLLPGFTPNPTNGEWPTYVTPNGQFMLERTSPNGGLGSRTWNPVTGEWGPVTAVPGIASNGATLSPDGKSLFLTGGGGVIQRSKLQSDGTWSTPVTIVPGGQNYSPYFNGNQLFFQHSGGGSSDVMEYDYNSSLDTFSNGRTIPSLHGSGGNGFAVPWVSQNGTDMIADFARSDTTQDIYSAHYDGNNWILSSSPLPYLHKDLLNMLGGVAETEGMLIFSSSPETQQLRIWEAPISGLTGSTSITFGLTVSTRVVGYLPDWEFTDLSNIDLSALTQINYFSIVANADGSLPASSEDGASLSNLQSVVSAAHTASPRVAVSITIDPSTPFLAIAQNTTYSASFVNNLISFCSTYNLDGIDLDYEPGTLTAAQQTTYGNLVAAIHAQTTAHGLTLSAAVKPSPMVIPPADVSDIDCYYLMDYDLEYNSSAPCNESITNLTNWANYLESGGVSRSHLLMGVPFYGSEGTSWSLTSSDSYGTILSNYYAINGSYPDPNMDMVTISGTTWGFNGVDTIQGKAQYIFQNGYGGVMIWALGQDYFPNGQYNQYSLLPTIKRVVTSPATTLTLTPAVWTSAGLTLTVDSDGNLNVCTTGTTTPDVVPPCPLASVGNIVITSPSNSTANLTIDCTAGDPIPGGGLNYCGGGGLIIAGSGSVILSGTDTYAGGTTVSDGTLLVTAASALPDGGSLTVGNGAQFSPDPSSDISSNAASAAILGGSSATIAMVSSTSPASSSLVLPAQRTDVAAVLTSVTVPGSLSVLNCIGGRLGPFARAVVTPPIALPLAASVSSSPNDNPGKSVVDRNFSALATDHVIGSSLAERVAGNLAWLRQAANNSSNSDQNRKKDIAILAFEAVLADYGT